MPLNANPHSSILCTPIGCTYPILCHLRKIPTIQVYHPLGTDQIIFPTQGFHIRDDIKETKCIHIVTY